MFELRDLLLRELLDAVLFWVRRNYFKIAAPTKRQERIARAAARMNTAKCGADTRMLLDEIYAAIQVATAE